jgi:hypothetical protein
MLDQEVYGFGPGIFCNLLLLFTFCQVCLPVKGTAEIETGITEKFSWDQHTAKSRFGLDKWKEN